MSSRRPEEAVRKAIAAGYGDKGDVVAFGAPQDDTEVYAEGANLDLGDWVRVSGMAGGHLIAATPSADGQASWIGVVTHKSSTDGWVRVKTCGVAKAKVTNAAGKSAGDKLAVQSGSTSADDADTGEDICGVFLRKFGGDAELSWVRLGGAGAPADLRIHHHTDASNTRVVDATGPTLTGYLWHVWKVNLNAFTGGDPRLMHAFGGGTTHGEANKEGYGWAGYIQPTPDAKMGFGIVGGQHAAGLQGVLGAEGDAANSEHSGRNRLNWRALGGFNAWDRYGSASPLTWPTGIGSILSIHPPQDAIWYPHDSCITEFGCINDVKWWAGGLIWNTHHGAFANGTGWTGEWQVAVPTERNCVTVSGIIGTPTPPTYDCEWPCQTITNPGAMWTNAWRLNGSYENVIPYGYVACTGRLEEMDGLTSFIIHYQSTIKWLHKWTAFIDTLIHCIDAQLDTSMAAIRTNFQARQMGAGDDPGDLWTKCCGRLEFEDCRVTIDNVEYGPPEPEEDCADTECDGEEA